MRSWNMKGTELCKLQRWLSINSCWPRMRQEVWGAKAVLGEMLDIDEQNELFGTDWADEAAPVGGPGVAASADAAAVAAAARNTGYKKKAYNFVTIQSCFFIDSFCALSRSLSVAYSQRAHGVKTPSDSVRWHFWTAR